MDSRLRGNDADFGNPDVETKTASDVSFHGRMAHWISALPTVQAGLALTSKLAILENGRL